MDSDMLNTLVCYIQGSRTESLMRWDVGQDLEVRKEF